jgi:hypothetical protein
VDSTGSDKELAQVVVVHGEVFDLMGDCSIAMNDAGRSLSLPVESSGIDKAPALAAARACAQAVESTTSTNPAGHCSGDIPVDSTGSDKGTAVLTPPNGAQATDPSNLSAPLPIAADQCSNGARPGGPGGADVIFRPSSR